MKLNLPTSWLYFLDDREARSVLSDLEKSGVARVHQTRQTQVGDHVYLMVGEGDSGRVMYQTSVIEIAKHSAEENEIRLTCRVRAFHQMLISDFLTEEALEKQKFPLDRAEYDIARLNKAQMFYLATVFSDRNRYGNS